MVGEGRERGGGSTARTHAQPAQIQGLGALGKDPARWEEHVDPSVIEDGLQGVELEPFYGTYNII